MNKDEMRVKFRPRKINLEPRDISKISYLADGEIEEDPLGRHAPGTTFVINHGDLGTVKFPHIMFPAPNPVEFYIYSAIKNLDNIKLLEPAVLKDYSKVNDLLLEEFQFCIFSVCALEAFLNQMIPSNFTYTDKKSGLVIIKSEIENKWSIQDKIKIIIPKIYNISIAGNAVIWSPLVLLIDLRNDLIHLKTVASDFRSYQDIYKRLLDHNYEESFRIIQNVISLIGSGKII